MRTQRGPRRRHVPQRTCVGCREVLAKRELVRVVRTPGGVILDPGGRAAGRGAYLHDRRSCWEIALKGVLEKALKTRLTPEDRTALQSHLESLPAE